jgi:membrane-associated phospholipid phosphatase
MKLCFIALLALVSQQARAWGWSDFKHEAASPVTDKKARTILLVGTGLTVASIIFEEELDRSHDKVVDNKPLGDFSLYGDMAGQLIPNVAYVLGQSLAHWNGNERASTRAMGMFKATAYAASTATVLKYTIREPRPNEHKDKNSFPSGHSTTAFAFGGYVFAEHGWQWGVPALALATLTGISRVNDNRHRVHDVLAGTTIGLAYAFGIAGVQGSKTVSTYQLIPLYDADVKGLALSYAY